MKRIVLLTSRPEPNDALVAWLKRLFPECEIQIVYKEGETLNPCEADAGWCPS